MKTNFTVRPAQIEDATDIVDFQLKMALETEHLKLELNTVTAGVKAVFEHPEFGNYYVAVTPENQIIASLLTTFEWSDWRNAQVLWLQSVYVEQQFRKQGVFELMYQYINELVIRNEHISGIRLYVDVRNTNAQTVYQKVGMTGEHYKVFEDMKA